MLMMMFKALYPSPARLLAVISLLAGGLALSAAQEPSSVRLGALWTGPYTMVERSDWSRYDNGKYTGHVYHEVRASIKPESPDTGAEAFFYRGNFFVLEETLRDMRASARPVNNIVPVSFTIFRDGNMVIDEDNGYPSLRGFPAFPQETVAPGARWAAQGQRAVDPRHTGKPALVPFTAEYEYRGTELYQGIPIHRVAAKYALRYRNQGEGFPEDFPSLQGTHTVDIFIQVSNGLPLFIRDNLDETYSWPDGATLRFRGFTLIFSRGAAPINRETMIASLGNSLGIRDGKSRPETPPAPRPQLKPETAPTPQPQSRPEAAPAPQPKPEAAPTPQPQSRPETPPAPQPQPQAARRERPPIQPELPAKGLELVSVPEGVRLIVQDIRFAPDSDEFLREEWPRLDIIARALTQAAPDQNFLVEGHTA
ncbi:MAG: hypothetical protein LBB77_00940, partial [Treponema sp.]|nr:hypothetical protein [Treponema sp.]